MTSYLKYLQEIITLGQPLKDKTSIQPLVEALKNKKIVMLGESSHGTQEFYEWRQAITQDLIMNHGFDFVAVEGDWPPCQEINQFVAGKKGDDAHEVLSRFNRWPTWMWANTEVLSFVEWLKSWNEGKDRPVGVHGLDVYSLYESMDRVVNLLRKLEPDLARLAEKKYSCLESYRHDEKAYARSLLKTPAGCKKEILEVLNATLSATIKDADSAPWFDVRQNARIVNNAESYYRAMIFGEDDSWNVRDNHMIETLEALLPMYGHDSKAVIWAHNTHIGDYRATDMVMNGQINIGGLAREIYGAENVGLVGFGTNSGTVTASYAWDGPVTTFTIPEALPGSLEETFHSVIGNVGMKDFFLIFDPSNHRSALSQVKGHRAIGVVYDPELEHLGNYVPTSLANRYDAFLYIDKTQAITSLNVPFDNHKYPETYPYGNKM